MNTRNKRPVLKIPLSPTEYGLEVFAVLGFLFGVVATRVYWTRVPESIPTHFGAAGQPDAWGAKWNLLLLPAVSLVIYALFTILSRFPHIYNYPVRITEENAERQYRIARSLMYWMKAEIVWLFTYIEWQSIQTALGKSYGLGILMTPVTLVILFATVIVYYVRMRRAG
ncbi:MAG: DUF1648 domain-containing protein, partial [Armatimonadetes bacterium]|nr:DUF1648 domain-containing protein [Armatimonadota bacterium]